MADVCPHHGLDVFQDTRGRGGMPPWTELREWYNDVFLLRMRTHFPAPVQDASRKGKDAKVRSQPPACRREPDPLLCSCHQACKAGGVL